MSTNIFVGSYSDKGADGIYCYSLDTTSHKLKLISKSNLVENPSYLALTSNKDRIYSVSEIYEFEGKQCGAVAVLDYKDKEYSLVDLKATNGQAPCHVLLDEDSSKLYVSNYFGGSIAMYNIEDTGKLDMCDFVKHRGCGPHKERQEATHMHYCGFIDGKVCGADLGIDEIKCYDTSSGKLMHENDIEIFKGAGVRHFIVSNKNNNLIFAVCELTSEIMVIKKVDNNYKITQRISTLPQGFTESTCAAIKQSINGKYVLASNRGHDSIAVYELREEKLQLVNIVDSKGKTPRDFLVLQNHVVIANQDSDSIVVFTFDENIGELVFADEITQCKKPVCVTC